MMAKGRQVENKGEMYRMVQVFRDMTLCFDICENKAEVFACKNGGGKRQDLGVEL
jgi:hypothetical protein